MGLSVTPPWRRIAQDTLAVGPEPIPDEGTHHAHPEDQASLTHPRVPASVSKASGPWAGQHESDGAFWKRHDREVRMNTGDTVASLRRRRKQASESGQEKLKMAMDARDARRRAARQTEWKSSTDMSTEWI